jgi:hypothetical protein
MSLPLIIYAETRRKPRTHHVEDHPIDAWEALYVRNGYRAEVCTGEAHSSPHIDNCSLCAPNWGIRAVKVTSTGWCCD